MDSLALDRGSTRDRATIKGDKVDGSRNWKGAKPRHASNHISIHAEDAGIVRATNPRGVFCDYVQNGLKVGW
jgi:hypothetical protein